MKITIFTSNGIRHKYFINLLSDICEELFVIQEIKIKKNSITPTRYPKDDIFTNYFHNVNKAQEKLFGKHNDIYKKNTNILKIKSGSINNIKLDLLSNYLNSDYYIIFGASYIKAPLIHYLIKKKAINIHAGISPYYRGTDCNFWALYDNNPHLVGSTIHLLSEGLDNGPILYHSMPNLYSNHFEYTMSSIKSAFYSLCLKLQNREILKIKPLIQNINNEIRYSVRSQLTEEILRKFLNNKINIKNIKFYNNMLKDPFFYTDNR